jgi:pimeloyl-ACP methyl ester carboxylesterase
MAGYVDLPSGRTWYAEHGTAAPGREPLVLLHGGVVDGRFFDQNVEPLAARFHVFVPDLRGHGHTPDADGPLSYERLAREIAEFLEAVVGGPAHVVGHSIGAGVALTVALRRPDLVRDLVLVSGAYHHDGVLVGASDGDGDDDVDVEPVVAAFGASYAEVSPDGADHYPVVIRKVADMDRRDPAFAVTDLAGVASRTLVMAGDDDIVTLEHTVDLYRGIGNSELAIVPGTSHFLLQEKPDLCNAIIVGFLTLEPVATVAPIRRATLPVEQ